MTDPRDDAQINEGVELPWRRFVAIGDSFAEGLGDPEPSLPGGIRGWADRFAESLAAIDPEVSYANLAVRGKLIGQVRAEQMGDALDLKPDLVAISAGGNDVLRPGSDPDEITAMLDGMVREFARAGATVLLFTSVDVQFQPVFRAVRGKAAIYNENLRRVAKRHDAYVVDLWSVEELQDSRFWDTDRLHMNALGHHTVARAMLRTLNIPNSLEPMAPPPVPSRTWRQARREDVVWARTYFVPWVVRRIRRVSSGDAITAKRPEVSPVIPPVSISTESGESDRS